MNDVPDTPDTPELIAYRINRSWPMRIVPAGATRDWIDATRSQFARRCLPLLIANQSGWVVLNSHPIRATWNGGERIADVTIERLGGGAPHPASSHFGHGILTFNLPFLFRTPPGIDLLVRGPVNMPKDAIAPLEGLVETDWAEATFTMNWKFTRPGAVVEFGLEEPICMIVPQPRGALERYAPAIRPIESDPDLHARYDAWAESRQQHNRDLKVPDSEAAKIGWEKHYLRGESPAGTKAPEHRTVVRLREFDDPEGITPAG
jgi:hypothetical protein